MDFISHFYCIFEFKFSLYLFFYSRSVCTVHCDIIKDLTDEEPRDGWRETLDSGHDGLTRGGVNTRYSEGTTTSR